MPYRVMVSFFIVMPLIDMVFESVECGPGSDSFFNDVSSILIRQVEFYRPKSFKWVGEQWSAKSEETSDE